MGGGQGLFAEKVRVSCSVYAPARWLIATVVAFSVEKYQAVCNGGECTEDAAFSQRSPEPRAGKNEFFIGFLQKEYYRGMSCTFQQENVALQGIASADCNAVLKKHAKQFGGFFLETRLLVTLHS